MAARNLHIGGWEGVSLFVFLFILWDQLMFLPRVRLLGVCLGVVVSRYSLYVSAIETGSITCFAENDSHSLRLGGGIGGCKICVCFYASCGLGEEDG